MNREVKFLYKFKKKIGSGRGGGGVCSGGGVTGWM